MIIYVDADYKCYLDPAADRTEVDEPFFDNKCRTYVEGYKRVPAGAEYMGELVTATMLFPFVPLDTLILAQKGYEDGLAAAESAYRKGVDSI